MEPHDSSRSCGLGGKRLENLRIAVHSVQANSILIPEFDAFSPMELFANGA